MKIVFKLNTGVIKTGKNSQTRFTDENKKELELLENDPKLLFNSFMNSYKHIVFGFNNLDFRDKVDFNVLKKTKGINNITFNKSIKGCFATYIFDIQFNK